MNALAKTTSLPTPIAPELGRKVRYFSNCLDPAGLGHTIALSKAPRESERQMLALRGAQIDEWMRPAGRSGALDEVTALFSTRGVKAGADTDVQATMAIYVEDLFDLPGFALAKACKDFRQGSLGDRKWVPTQAEIRHAAHGYLAELARERRQIANVLAAKVLAPQCSPEKRVRVLEFAAEVQRELQMPQPPGPGRDHAAGQFPPKPAICSDDDVKAEAAVRLDALSTLPVPRLSPEALAKFGIEPKRADDEMVQS